MANTSKGIKNKKRSQNESQLTPSATPHIPHPAPSPHASVRCPVPHKGLCATKRVANEIKFCTSHKLNYSPWQREGAAIRGV